MCGVGSAADNRGAAAYSPYWRSDQKGIEGAYVDQKETTPKEKAAVIA